MPVRSAAAACKCGATAGATLVWSVDMTDRRELLIDAFNVMFAHPRLGPLVRRDQAAAREAFLVFVRQNRPVDATRVYVVFDAHRDKGPAMEMGRQDTSYSGSVHAVFAHETADVWIQRRVREHPDPTLVTVITSDNAIIATVKAYGARLLRVKEFLRLPERRKAGDATARDRAAEKPERVTRRELEEWERLFGERHDEE